MSAALRRREWAVPRVPRDLPFARLPLCRRSTYPSAALPRIENVAQRIAEKIRSEHREADGDTGKDDEPRRRADILGGGLRQHAAPGRKRLRRAATNEQHT